MSAVTAQAGLELLQSGFEGLSILVWKSTGPVVYIETKTPLHSRSLQRYSRRKRLYTDTRTHPHGRIHTRTQLAPNPFPRYTKFSQLLVIDSPRVTKPKYSEPTTRKASNGSAKSCQQAGSLWPAEPGWQGSSSHVERADSQRGRGKRQRG